MKTLEQRYSDAIKKIGYDQLLKLPNEVKELLQNNCNFETKVKMLELIANTL